jgi:nitrogen fixation NifU-like protein
MLSDVVKGKSVDQLAGIGKEDVLEELGIPLTPIRLKCAMLSVGVLKVALSELTGDPLPEEWNDPSSGIEWKSA